MYQLKCQPEDFLVTEISSPRTAAQGPYLYYKLTKRNWNTLDAVKRIAELLRIPEKKIGFAGSKDRVAVTEQVISIKGVQRSAVDALRIRNAELVFLGHGDEPISLGDLEANHFHITVRNLEQEQKLLPSGQIVPPSHIPNYFDEQRFGKDNIRIGKCLVQKNFKAAVELLSQQPFKKFLEKSIAGEDSTVKSSAAGSDYVGALRKLPLRFLRLLVNAYQSWLWNETLALYLLDHGSVWKKIPYSAGTMVFARNAADFKELKVPLMGFGTSVQEEGMQGEGMQEIMSIATVLMKREGISFDDFIIPQIPELSLEGELRAAFVEVKDFHAGAWQDDEMHPGKSKAAVSFTLPKGSYATVAIRALFA